VSRTDTTDTAPAMLERCRRDGHAVRRVPDDEEAGALRAAIRATARAVGLRIRTARIDDTVVVVRTDADIWTDDRATMRAKLTAS
jgi:hypothetical protein